MRGLLAKVLRESRLLTLVLGGAFLVVSMLLTFVLPRMQAGLSDFLLTLPFVKTVLAAMTGLETAEGLTVQMLIAILWTHPVVLSLVWGYEIALCTRMPAGEIDRGTIDVLLGWPVSRRTAYHAETIGWLAGGVFVVGLGVAGYFVMAPAIPPAQRPSAGGIALVGFNLYCVYLAVGGLTLLASSLSDRRGRAVATIVALVVTSFLLNFLAQFWSVARSLSFLSLSHYYQPARILQERALDGGDVGWLLAIAAASWLAGREITARRSICTV